MPIKININRQLPIDYKKFIHNDIILKKLDITIRIDFTAYNFLVLNHNVLILNDPLFLTLPAIT